MTAPFANIQARINQQTVARLANANVTYKGKTFTGIFDKNYVDDLGMAGNTPVLTVLLSDVVGIKRGDEINVDGALFKVNKPEPDGSGMIILRLTEVD